MTSIPVIFIWESLPPPLFWALGLLSDPPEEKNLLVGLVTALFIPCVSCVLLEGKSKECNFLVGHSVKKAVDNSVCESPSLILIHGNHLVPVSCHFRKVQCLRKVHKIEHILLKTTPTKT